MVFFTSHSGSILKSFIKIHKPSSKTKYHRCYLQSPPHRIRFFRPYATVFPTPVRNSPHGEPMSPTPSPLNPSQTVERIREIIVGRHLERLEQRVARLETTGPTTPVSTVHLEDRLFANEARLEALKENVQRLADSTREQTDLRLSQYREETQRLAAQIQHVAALKANEPATPAIHQLERKIGSWLTDWQSSFHVQLNDRDQRLANQLRGEVAALWESTESQITRLESRAVDRDSIEERFNRIALAARALAECASPTPIGPGSARP
jgi:hypothetical protein